MNVPHDYSFLKVMDLYFKVHFVFSISYDPSLVQFMKVFQYYVYDINDNASLSPATILKAQQIFTESLSQ